jgi:hypothetical protein
MKRLLRMITLGAVLAAVLPVASLSAQAADPVNGTWELNLAKSKFDPGPAPKSQARTYKVDEKNVTMISKGVDAEGKPTLVEYTGSYDGKDYAFTGNPNADTISLKRIDDFTIESMTKKAGKVLTTGTRVISKDGKVMTITQKGTNAKGETINNTLVFDKQ